MQHCSHGAGPAAADGAPFVVAAAVAGSVVVVEAAEPLVDDDAELESAEVILSQIGAQGRDSTCFLSVVRIQAQG